MNKNNHHIYKAEQIDWEKLESIGISTDHGRHTQSD